LSDPLLMLAMVFLVPSVVAVCLSLSWWALRGILMRSLDRRHSRPLLAARDARRRSYQRK
jgi:hypothetical protein